jgi:predicted tellurium resistance membrane protein TerC
LFSGQTPGSIEVLGISIYLLPLLGHTLELFTSANLIAVLTLTSLEIVLGIDNIVFIAILAGKLKEEQRELARKLGLGVAVISRLFLVLSLSWIMGLKNGLFEMFGHMFTGKDILLIIGGVFLIGKATHELHNKVEGELHDRTIVKKAATLGSVLLQVAFIDIVFSLDSVITAFGMVDEVAIMIAAILLSVGIMLIFSGAITRYIDQNPTIKVLALSFLLLIGVMLVAEGCGQHIPKGYIYFAMAFSFFVEMLNIRSSSRA